MKGFAEVSALFLRLFSLNLVYIFAHIMLALSPMPVNRRSVSFLILEKGRKWFVKMVSIVYKTRFLAEPF